MRRSETTQDYPALERNTLNTSADTPGTCGCSGHCSTASTVPAATPINGLRSSFRVPGMDCPSEERVIRLALEGADGLRHVGIDLSARTVTLYHDGPLAPLQTKLAINAAIWRPACGRNRLA